MALQTRKVKRNGSKLSTKNLSKAKAKKLEKPTSLSVSDETVWIEWQKKTPNIEAVYQYYGEEKIFDGLIAIPTGNDKIDLLWDEKGSVFARMHTGSNQEFTKRKVNHVSVSRLDREECIEVRIKIAIAQTSEYEILKSGIKMFNPKGDTLTRELKTYCLNYANITEAFLSGRGDVSMYAEEHLDTLTTVKDNANLDQASIVSQYRADMSIAAIISGSSDRLYNNEVLDSTETIVRVNAEDDLGVQSYELQHPLEDPDLMADFGLHITSLLTADPSDLSPIIQTVMRLYGVLGCSEDTDIYEALELDYVKAQLLENNGLNVDEIKESVIKKVTLALNPKPATKTRAKKSTAKESAAKKSTAKLKTEPIENEAVTA